ncbi:inositol-3-phosphate synthase [Saccharothrix lopnurensis]|uniref:Inositol-3-phosphate synthase n=1 Tax=Saccharothrix lopnurensis TaxID=1670621 RepID=A0ABW1PHX4_9PSEU
MTGNRTGVWLVGARGSVATTAVAGAAALRAGVLPPTGLVTALPDFAGIDLPALDDLVFGGHDVVVSHPAKRAELLTRAGVLPSGVAGLVVDDLIAADAEVRPGAHADAPDPQWAVVERLAADISDFRRRNGLRRVLVVNVAATEPPVVPHAAHADWSALEVELGRGVVLPPSSLYACAAFLAGCGFVDFTPSTGARLPALHQLAVERGAPYAGSDGKTGETLVKSVLASLFTRRALRVRSWSGTNLLGGGDGANLADADRAAAKAASKAVVLERLLGHPVEGGVHIHHVEDLGEWKTAWDHIGFEGFLGVRMTMQFTWQGCDSALAAPLVLDLARLLCLADGGGPVPELGFFFKDPLGVVEHGLEAQYAALVRWARR